MAHADDDEVLVSPQTQNLISPFFETETGRTLVLQDRTAPITPHRVVKESGYDTRLQAAENSGLSLYVGRQKELDTLNESFQQAQDGSGQFVTVVGEAGLGKSRLLYEFNRVLDHKVVKVLQAQCRSYGGNVPYLPLIEAFRRGLRLDDNDPHETPPEHVAQTVREIAPILEEFIPLYFHLLSIPNEEHFLPQHLEGEHLRLAISDALCAFFTLSSNETPLVLLIEDWHWSDEASRDVVRRLVEMIPAYPLLMVVTYRPEYSGNWGNLDHHTPIHLRPLQAASSIAIVRSVTECQIPSV